MKKEYSLKRESVAKLFRQALKAGLELPECKRPEESDQTSNPNYCPYHRVVSHPIEDCYVFKDWLEKKDRSGEFTLSDSVLIRPKRESTKMVTLSSVPSTGENLKDKPNQDEEWETVISKKTVKMLKQLKGVPGVKWKYPLEPELELRERPMSSTSVSSSTQKHSNYASSSRHKMRSMQGSLKKSKKSTKEKKSKKKTMTQKILKNLEEYHQPARKPVRLAEFMQGLQILDSNEKEEEETLPVETCRVISVTSNIPRTSPQTSMMSEFCLMALQSDESSEDLCFPEESEPLSQTQGGMTKGASKKSTSSESSEADEMVEVQLRSSRALPSPPGPSKKDKGHYDERRCSS